VFYIDYVGPAHLRLNFPELAPEPKRVWHPWTRPWQVEENDHKNEFLAQQPFFKSLLFLDHDFKLRHDPVLLLGLAQDLLSQVLELRVRLVHRLLIRLQFFFQVSAGQLELSLWQTSVAMCMKMNYQMSDGSGFQQMVLVAPGGARSVRLNDRKLICL